MRTPRVVWFLLPLAVALSGAPVRADLASVTVSPPTVSAAIGRPATISLRWAVSASGQNNGTVLASSTVLLILGPGGQQLIAQIPTTVSATVAPAAIALINENLALSRELLLRLSSARDGNGQPLANFVLRRSFSDGGPSVIADATLYLTGGAGATGFDVTRLALRFEGSGAERIVAPGEALTAVVDLDTIGSGRIAGQWEVADPASTGGEPMFRPLRSERISVGAGQSLRLPSPPLPTAREGLYLLRFRLTEPRQEEALLRYLVGGGARAAGQLPFEISARGPAEGAAIDEKTLFSWQASRRAAAYRLEVFHDAAGGLPSLGERRHFELPAEPPVTGVLVGPEAQQVSLAAISLQRLEPGRRYLWRVVAIGEQGEELGATPLQFFQTR